MTRILIEAACEGLEDALAAAREGADRIELCAALATGGLTPSAGLLLEADARLTVPFVVMIRPRPGGFTYTRLEQDVMARDAEAAVAAGAAGIVFGALRPDGGLDRMLVRRLVRAAAGAETVFHRAFDRVAAPERALAVLAEEGVTRVLTAGGRRSAFAHAERLARLIASAAGSIEILPGGGLRPPGLAAFVERTGARQVHFAFRRGRVRAARRALGTRAGPARPGATRRGGGTR